MPNKKTSPNIADLKSLMQEARKASTNFLTLFNEINSLPKDSYVSVGIITKIDELKDVNHFQHAMEEKNVLCEWAQKMSELYSKKAFEIEVQIAAIASN
jgi:hypothetical protein